MAVFCLEDPKRLDLDWHLSSKCLNEAYYIGFGCYLLRLKIGIILDLDERLITFKKFGSWPIYLMGIFIYTLARNLIQYSHGVDDYHLKSSHRLKRG